jgi:hypothetical protein
VDPEEGSLGSPKFFVPYSPPVRAHGLGFDLNLDKLTRKSGSGVRDSESPCVQPFAHRRS